MTEIERDQADEYEDPEHRAGYQNVLDMVRNQTMEEDLKLIDILYGRYALSYIPTAKEVKKEALRQVELDWRTGHSEEAEDAAQIARAMRQW